MSGQSHTTSSSRRLSGTRASLQEPVCRILKSSPCSGKKPTKKKNNNISQQTSHKLGGTESSESVFPEASSRLLQQVSVCSNQTDNSCVGVQGSQRQLWIPDVLSFTKNSAPSALVFGLDKARVDNIPHSLGVSLPLSYLRGNKHLQQL